MLRVCINSEGNIVSNIMPEVGDFDGCDSAAECRYNNSVNSSFMSIVTVVNDNNEKIGFCAFFSEIPSPTIEDIVYQIEYVLVKNNERRKGVSNIMVPYVASELVLSYRKLIEYHSFDDIHLTDNSDYISDEGYDFSEKVKNHAIDEVKKIIAKS